MVAQVTRVALPIPGVKQPKLALRGITKAQLSMDVTVDELKASFGDLKPEKFSGVLVAYVQYIHLERPGRFSLILLAP